MSKYCPITGKGPMSGNARSHSLRATRRRWNVNLQKRKVMIDGKVVVKDHKLVNGDIDAIRAEAKAQAERLWAEMVKYPETYTYHYDD